MIVGDDVAVSGNDDTGSGCFRSIGLRLTEETAGSGLHFCQDLNNARSCFGSDLCFRKG